MGIKGLIYKSCRLVPVKIIGGGGGFQFLTALGEVGGGEEKLAEMRLRGGGKRAARRYLRWPQPQAAVGDEL